MIHHLMLAFYPRFHGLLFPDAPGALFGTPLFALINGSAAVVLFFVLSGFVLSVRAFQTQSTTPLIVGAIKRWPRLVGPVLVVSLISGVLAGWGWYSNQSVAQAISSPWLGFDFDKPAAQWTSVGQAALEGSLTTFISGQKYFNSSLWTMYYEFYGSMLVFLTAGFVVAYGRVAALAAVVAIAAAAPFINPHFLCFFIGVAIARFYSSALWPKFAAWMQTWPMAALACLACVIIVLLGYHDAYAPTKSPLGGYAILEPFFYWAPIGTRVIVHSIASVLLLVTVLAQPGARRLLGGPVGAWLGRLTFPLYLLQVPVIYLIGAGIVSLALAHGLTVNVAIAMGFAGALIANILAAVPLMWFETWWLSRLQRLMTTLTSRRSSRAGSGDATTLDPLPSPR